MPADSATAYVRNGIASGAHVRNGGSQKPRATLRREVHTAQEVLKARVGAQGIEHRTYVPEWRVGLVFSICLFKPSQGFLLLIQRQLEGGRHQGVEFQLA